MWSVLFICSANQCRSPLAAAFLAAQVTQRGQSADWEIQSAGTWAAPELPASREARAVAGQNLLDLSHHRSRTVDRRLLQSANVILVMTRNHREAIEVEFPEVRSRVYLLSQLVGQTFDIEDPSGGSSADYEVCAAEIQGILEKGFGRLAELAQQARP